MRGTGSQYYCYLYARILCTNTILKEVNSKFVKYILDVTCIPL